MPASLIGVSNTRRSNSACSPSVTRKTPPERPTSSPKTKTRSSSRRASRSAALSAATIVSSATEHLSALGRESGGRLGVRVIEHPLHRRRRLGDHALADGHHLFV